MTTNSRPFRATSGPFLRVVLALVAFLGIASAAPAFASLGAWSTPVNLSEAGGSAGDSRIAVDGSGNAVAVWLRFDADFNRIAQSSWSDDGGATWSAPVNLSAPGEWAGGLNVAIDGAGVAHVVWDRYDGNNGRVQYTRSDDGGLTWNAPVYLSTGGSDAARAQVAVDGSGNPVVVWRGSDGSDDIIQSSRSTDGGVSWSTPVDLSLSGQSADLPQIVAAGSDNVVAVWQRSDGSNQIIQSSSSANGGASWSVPANLSASGQDSVASKVAVDDSGNVVAVWLYSPSSDSKVQSSRLTAGGVSWSTPEDLSVVGEEAATPQVSADGSGNFVAVWRLTDVGGTIIQSSQLAAGEANWSEPAQLSVSGRSADNPQVSANGAGNAVAVWQRSDGSDLVIQFSESSDGGASWSVPAELSESGQNAITPQVAVDLSGNAVANWRRSNGENEIIQASRSSTVNGGGDELANTGVDSAMTDTPLFAGLGLLLVGAFTLALMRRHEAGNVK